MFTAEEREQLRESLTRQARQDERITGTLTGMFAPSIASERRAGLGSPSTGHRRSDFRVVRRIA